ncbi:MAG: hypothetical protein ACRDPE_20165 [Solirubrobacterales bacterium]
MHTARQLNESLFAVEIEGGGATRDDLFRDWGPLDRFGVVIREPFGVVGASYLLQLAITAFYDARPERRNREALVYPDVFVFHVGGRFGDHAFYDVYPPRKEVFVGNDPAEVLGAINDRGITRLAVPDRDSERVQHDWKEPAQALDRIVDAWAYTAGGRTKDADVAITASSLLAEANTKITLHSQESYHEKQKVRAAIGDVSVPETELLTLPVGRDAEVPSADRDAIRDRRLLLDGPEGRTETYRRIDVRQALGMLHRGPAPAFRPQPDLEKMMGSS